MLRTSRRNRHRLDFPAVWDRRVTTRIHQKRLTSHLMRPPPRARRRTRRSWANLQSCWSLFHRCRIIFRRDWCLFVIFCWCCCGFPERSPKVRFQFRVPSNIRHLMRLFVVSMFSFFCYVRRLGLADNDDDGWDVGDACLLSGLGYWSKLIEENNNTSFFVFVMSIFLCYVLLYD